MQNVRITFALVVGLAIGGQINTSWAYQFSGFGADAFNGNTSEMDAVLGIAGYVIEDFEDSALVPNLSVEYTHTGLGPMTDLPGLFEADSQYFRRNFSGHNWDGPHILYTVQPSTSASSLVIRIDGGTTSFGIGFSDYSTKSHAWQINDGEIRTMADIPNFLVYDFGRNGYLRIDAEAGDELITGVTFFHSAQYDALEYDHIAFIAPPEGVPSPGTLPLMMLSLVAIAICVSMHCKNSSRISTCY